MDRRKKRSKQIPLTGNNKDVDNMPVPRYLVLNNENSEDNMANVPFSLLSNVINNVAGKVNLIKRLGNGAVLIETKSVAQSNKLMKLKYFPPKVPVQVSPHRWLNLSKGVIKCWGIDLATMKTELQEQSVVNIKPLITTSKTQDGKSKKYKSLCYILTFSLPMLPKTVKIGCFVINVTPYVPQPKMCYRCYKYGHISKYCKLEKQLCRKCTKEGHDIKDCPSAAVCANCAEAKESKHDGCLGYMIHRKILEIESILKNVNLDE